MTQAKDKRIEEGRKLLDHYEQGAAASVETTEEADEVDLRYDDLQSFMAENAHYFLYDLPRRIEELEEGFRRIQAIECAQAPDDDEYGYLTCNADGFNSALQECQSIAASPLSEQPETGERTPEQKSAFDQLLKDDGELYDDKTKLQYSLGNGLRGNVYGWFSSDEEAWDALRASFNRSFPSDGGRIVCLTKELFQCNSLVDYPTDEIPPQAHGDVERVDLEAIKDAFFKHWPTDTDQTGEVYSRPPDGLTADQIDACFRAAISAMRPVPVDRELEFAWTREGEILVGYNPRSEEGGWIRVGVVTKAVSKLEAERENALRALADAREKIVSVNAVLLSAIEGVKP